MQEKTMGRVRLGRLAAATIPAMVLSAGLGLAMVQGLVSAQLSAAQPFQVTSSSASATGLELSMREAATATSNTNTATTQKKAALVTLKQGSVNNLCLAANQPVPILGNIGLKLVSPGNVSLGDVDLNADAIAASAATLPQTDIGVAQSELDHQKTVASGYSPGGWGLESTGNVSLTDLDAKAYALSLQGLNLASGLTITPTLGTSSC